jgi:hypothetical protein
VAVSPPFRRDDSPQVLSVEQEALKRELYENIPARRRKFIDRIGYDNWDPFQKPNDPVELRTDISRRTTQQLVREFLQSLPPDAERGGNYSQGALECALGIVNRDDRYLGMLDFALWYHELLKKEGRLPRGSV